MAASAGKGRFPANISTVTATALRDPSRQSQLVCINFFLGVGPASLGLKTYFSYTPL